MVTKTMPLLKRIAPSESSGCTARKRTAVGDIIPFAELGGAPVLDAGLGESSVVKAALLCQSTQEQLYRYYPELKPADLCPGCEVKICFHANSLSHAEAALGSNADF